MFNSHNTAKKLVTTALCTVVISSGLAFAEVYSIGSTPTDAEIKGWDIDIRPDGLGLPPGQGSVEEGEFLYDEKCASCHGVFGEGEKRWPKLAGGQGTLTNDRPDKTVGSYWPYASTLWDYIHRAMPFTAPQSLSDDEVYAITAYVLYLNELVEDDFVLTQQNLADITMPNVDSFYRDDRPDVNNERCMSNCKDVSTITVVHSLRGVTPTDHFKEDGNDGVAYAEEEVAVKESSELSAQALAGLETYQLACRACHDSGIAGAPKLGDVEQWTLRSTKGFDTLVNNALFGFKGEQGVMPAKGGQTQLSDQAVTDAVHYMVESSE
ncbi:c-type cytochrome [Reinekea marina]|uniref:C-type cytochrome n=1 Tax=Reinekea marina TaxID=1310421 RepID=A0ABV7WR89_9GAMM|nr:c-type cytochrome [Reinekea marina]MDN3647790.1 c-type cytochrome [Reinekea marina]